MAAPSAAAAAAAAAGPLPSWEKIEREATDFVKQHIYGAGSDEMIESISKLIGYRPDEIDEPTPAHIRELVYDYAHRPFEAFVHIRYPHVDQTTPEFYYSVLLAWFKTYYHNDRRANDLAGALVSGGAPAIQYIVESGRLTETAHVRKLIRALGLITGQTSTFWYDSLPGTTFSTHPAMRALEMRARYLENPRAAIESSRVYDVLAMRVGGPVAQHAATFADTRFGPSRPAEAGFLHYTGGEHPGYIIVPPIRRREPLIVRTHLAELQRIRAEMAETAALGSSLTAAQLLARVATSKRGMDELVDSVNKRQK